MIDARKLSILNAIIDDYILTSLPVGSRTITKKYNVGVSPATIRNEMSDLEELGYLLQPHVSAGRIPSIKAYRMYVDVAIDRTKDRNDVQELRSFLYERVKQLEDVVDNAAQAISELTHYPAMVMMPGQMNLKVVTLQLVPMMPGNALLVIVTDSGIVRNTVVNVSEYLDADGLYAISRALTERMAGRTLEEVQAMLSMYTRTAGVDGPVIHRVSELAAQMQKQSSVDSLSIAGTHNLLNFPEYEKGNGVRDILSVMEEKNQLLSLMKEGKNHVNVYIGKETGIKELQDCSVVTASYSIGHMHKGAVGIIGPTRMPYKQVIDTLHTISTLLSELFT